MAIIIYPEVINGLLLICGVFKLITKEKKHLNRWLVVNTFNRFRWLIIEEAAEQTELAIKAEGLERRGLTKRKRFQWRLAVTQSMDNLFSNL